MFSKQKNPYFEIFIIAFFISMSFLLPYIIMDKGLFLFFGDYDVQQVPFYMLAHNAIRSGNIFWSWTTDLGANFVGSYSFYLLGSPFFWLTVPLPSAVIPYTLGPLLALKMSMAALTSFAYIKRFVKKNEIAALGALLYAFSGFSIYNIFFNHFHEPMAFFPLLLIGLEEYMKNNRKGLFVVTVFINALVNYVFFFGEIIFLVIYWIVRMLSGEWQINFRKFLFLIFESVLGVALSSFLFIPAVLSTIINNRVGQLISGWNILLYDWNQRYPDILHSLFFPQDLPSRPNFFPDANNKWASISAWLPMVSLSGVLGFVMAKKGHWIKRILCVSLVMALIPGLNSMYVMFNQEYYARWYYMPVLIMALATAIAFEDPEINFMHGLIWTAIITAAFAFSVGLIPKVVNGKVTQIGLEAYPVRFWVYVIIAFLGLIITGILYYRFKRHILTFANYATIGLTIIVCVYANFFITTGKSYGYNGSWMKSVSIEGAKKISLDRSSFFRVDVLNGIDNQAMFWNLPNIQAFQSVVPASIMDFYPTVGVTRDVASRPSLYIAGLRPFLSVKYLFDADNSISLGAPGWVPCSNELGFKVWENKNFIPMGFTYTEYMTETQYNLSSQRDRLLLKAILLTNEQIAKYGNLLTNITNQETSNLSDSSMANDCANRRQYTCSTFKTDNSGFSAKITLNKDNLVFFSVPYDSGWSATVNGKPAVIEKVNVGFMAVKCASGDDNIRFVYTTPGLSAGIIDSIIAFIILFIYWFMISYVKKIRNGQPSGLSLLNHELQGHHESNTDH